MRKYCLSNLLCVVVLTLMVGCAHRAPVNKEHWQALARSDLDAAYKLVKDAHPGSIDEQNPEFLDWAESGYREALKLIPQVVSYDGMLAAVRFYVAGFADDHFLYSDNMRNNDSPMFVNGWLVHEKQGGYEVVAVAPAWRTPLPPIGARLVKCDGRAPDVLIRELVARPVNKRHVGGSLLASSEELLHLKFENAALKRCEFQTIDGKALEIAVNYQAINVEQFWKSFVFPILRSSRPQSNSFEEKGGVLWIRAGNFQPNSDEFKSLEEMLTRLRDVKGVSAIVFDTRGNGGGNSGLGDRILDAATGGLVFDLAQIERLPRTYAQWRVSDAAIKALGYRLDDATRRYGVGSSEAKWANDLRDEVKAAKTQGRVWVEQSGGPRVTRADVVARGGKLRRFAGKIALLTDSNCASACLDFADTVLKVPGAIHVGGKTRADTTYIDVGSIELPSGNRLVFPLKVWRNRVRGNNEQLTPDVPMNLDAMTEEMIYAKTVSALRNAP
jgi:hypothetical protein